jgi:hypothetical protein
MTLSQFLSTLTSLNVTATVYDTDGKTVVSEIRANTYASLEDTLESRLVKSWTIVNNYKINVILDEVVEPTPDPDNTDPDTNGEG